MPGYCKLGERCLVRHANQLIVVSRELQSYYFQRNMVEAPYTYLMASRKATSSECGSISTLHQFNLQHRDYVLYIGRLSEEKRIEDFIVAYEGPCPAFGSLLSRVRQPLVTATWTRFST